MLCAADPWDFLSELCTSVEGLLGPFGVIFSHPELDVIQKKLAPLTDLVTYHLVLS
jgi:hypothetical protein